MKNKIKLLASAALVAFGLFTSTAFADQPASHDPGCDYFRTLHCVDPAQPTGWCYAVNFCVHGTAAKWELWGASVSGVCTMLCRGQVDMGNNDVHTFVQQGGPFDQAGLYLILRDNAGGAWTYYPSNY